MFSDITLRSAYSTNCGFDYYTYSSAPVKAECCCNQNNK